jgi:hypothetical protein
MLGVQRQATTATIPCSGTLDAVSAYAQLRATSIPLFVSFAAVGLCNRVLNAESLKSGIAAAGKP